MDSITRSNSPIPQDHNPIGSQGLENLEVFHLRVVVFDLLRIFRRFRLVKFIGKFQTRVKILKIEGIIAFDKYLHELFFAFYFHLSKYLFLMLKNNEVADLTHFCTKCGCFESF